MRYTIPVILFIFLFIQIPYSGKAQSVCDSLVIEDLYFNAFNSNIVHLSVTNTSSQLFDYPGFILFDNNNDTFAKEDVSFFGIGTSSVHNLKVYPAFQGQTYFSGTAELYTNFYSSKRCTFSFADSLCPDSCAYVHPYLANWGSALVSGNFKYRIRNQQLQPVYEDSFQLDNNTQGDYDTVCLVPGIYTLEVDASTAMGGQLHIGLSQTGSPDNPGMAYHYQHTTLPFEFFNLCSKTNTIRSNDKKIQPPQIFFTENQLLIRSRNNLPINQVRILSISGQLLYDQKGNHQNWEIPFSYPTGIYILQLFENWNFWHQKVPVTY